MCMRDRLQWGLAKKTESLRTGLDTGVNAKWEDFPYNQRTQNNVLSPTDSDLEGG